MERNGIDRHGVPRVALRIAMHNRPLDLNLDSLIEYEPFVRRVLRKMMVEEDQLGDMVQETWVRVLRRPPENRQGVRGWLATVARNLARDAKRGKSRREDRERIAARPEECESVQASHERMELHRLVVHSVVELDEPYKSVVVLSYYEGMTSKEIALKLGRKDATVRSQLHRAHKLLKQKLDGEYGERREWMAIGVPWILSKEGAESLGTGVGVGVGSFVWIAALGALALGLVLWAPWRGAGADERNALGPAGGGQVDGMDQAGGGVELLAPGQWPAEIRHLVEEVAVSDPGDGRLGVRVTVDGKPRPGALVWAFAPRLRGASGFASEEAYGDWEWFKKYPAHLPQLARRKSGVARTDSNGVAYLDVDDSGAMLFGETELRFDMMAVRPTGDGELAEFELAGGPGLRVRVLGPSGRIAAHIPVFLLAGDGQGNWRKIDIRHSDPDSGEVRFVGFERLSPAQIYGVRAGLVGAPNPVWEWNGGSTPITIRVPHHGSLAWELAEGSGLTGATVCLQLKDGVQSGDWLRGKLEAGVWHGVALGAELDLQLRANAMGLELHWQGFGPVVDGEQVVAQLEKPEGIEVKGQLGLQGDGGALLAPRFSYELHLLDGARKQRSMAKFLPDLQGHFTAHLNVEPPLADPNGHWELEIVGRWVSKVGNRRVRIALGVQDMDGPIDLGKVAIQWDRHSIVGHVVGPDGQPLEGVGVQAKQDRFEGLVSGTTDVNGSFSLPGIWAEEVPVHLVPGQDWVLVEPVRVGKEEGSLVLSVKMADPTGGD